MHLHDSIGGSRVLGEVIIHSATTVAQVRQMIRDELGVAFSFVLKKCQIPLPRSVDTKRACLFVSSKDEYFVVIRN